MMGILGFKVALCLGYLRILSRAQKVYRFIVWFVLVFCILAHLAGTLVLILNCTPVSYDLYARIPVNDRLFNESPGP